MGDNALPVIITALLSAGGATFLAAAVRGVGSLRAGARASTRETIRDLADARDAAEVRERTRTRDLAFWQQTAAAYAYQLTRAGLTPDPPDPIPPSELAVAEPTSPAPRRRGRRTTEVER